MYKAWIKEIKMRRNILLSVGVVFLLVGMLASSVDASDIDCNASANGRSSYETGKQIGSRVAVNAWDAVARDCERLGEFLDILELPFTPHPSGVRAHCSQHGLSDGMDQAINDIIFECADECIGEGESLGRTLGTVYCNEAQLFLSNSFPLCDILAVQACESSFIDTVTNSCPEALDDAMNSVLFGLCQDLAE
jgi:hypothetical protein